MYSNRKLRIHESLFLGMHLMVYRFEVYWVSAQIFNSTWHKHISSV